MDFLAVLEIRGPGDPLFREIGVPDPLFYINPSRRGPAGGFWKRGSGTPPRRGEAWQDPGTPVRDPGPRDPTPGTAGGHREGLM